MITKCSVELLMRKRFYLKRSTREVKSGARDCLLNVPIARSGVKLSSVKFQMIELLYMQNLCARVVLRTFTCGCFAVN